MDVKDEEQKQCLERHNRLRWMEEQKRTLDAPISMCELMEAFKSQKNGKLPGPGGIPAECYKQWKDVLIGVYKQVVEKIK